MSKAQKTEQADARETLHKILRPGQTVYTVLRHVSRSGMSREISLHTASGDEIQRLSGLAARAMGDRLGKRDGIITPGCGMDMGFHLVYDLGRTLYPDGFGCIGEGCRSNDHSNGDRDYTPHGAVVPGPCCKRSVRCTCHDPSVWEVPGSYPDGCSGCGCHRAQHWHRDGGYALIQRWI